MRKKAEDVFEDSETKKTSKAYCLPYTERTRMIERNYEQMGLVKVYGTDNRGNRYYTWERREWHQSA